MREMKDSLDPWIGLIPKAWSTKRVKEFLVERKETCTSNDSYDLLAVSEYYGVAKKTDVISDNEFITHAESLEGYKICHPEDLVINIMLAWKRAMGVSQYLGITSPAYCVFSPKENICMRYFHYLFRTDYYAALFKQYSTGIIDSRLRLYPDKFLSLRCHFPPIYEQQLISDFLDRKCADIDNVLEKTRISIENYKRLKQSIITEAVTKGIRGTRPMKDSGIEWIGEIPADWHLIKLRHFGSCQNGISKSSEFFGEGSPFVSYSDVYKNLALPAKVEGKIKSSSSEQVQYSVKRGDVFFTRTSETIEEIGFSSVCLTNIPQATFAGFIIRVRPYDEKLIPEFSQYYFRSSIHRKYFIKEMNIVTRASLGQGLLNGLPILVPSTEEQLEIALFLGKKSSEIDTLIVSKKRFINELENYRKNLIYEYVTGKKDVMV